MSIYKNILNQTNNIRNKTNNTTHLWNISKDISITQVIRPIFSTYFATERQVYVSLTILFEPNKLRISFPPSPWYPMILT